MKFLLAISLFIVSTASAISVGFLKTSIPAYPNEYIFQLETDEDIYMFTVGHKVGNTLNLEASFGYNSEIFEDNSSTQYTNYNDKTTQAFGLGVFYQVTGNDFVSFSLGARLIYSDLELEQKDHPNDNKFKTTAKTFSPLARIDLNFPGVENLFLHTQFGLNYRKVESDIGESPYSETNYERTDFSITAPAEILSGIYYQF